MQIICSSSLAIFQTANAGKQPLKPTFLKLTLICTSVMLNENLACQKPYTMYKCHIHVYIQQYINATFSIRLYAQYILFLCCILKKKIIH